MAGRRSWKHASRAGRLTKTDSADPNAVKLTEYYYDTEVANRNPAWPTNNNRLMWYTEKVSDGQGGWSLQRTVYYTYTRNGDATNITIKDESAPQERRDLALTYARNGQLWLAVWDQWTVNSSYTPTWPGDPCGDMANGAVQSGTYTQTAAREFRYDGGRARYMARDVDPNNGFAPLTNQSWTEYGGDLPYEDHNVTVDGSGNAVFAPQTGYFGLAATLDENSGAKAYLHEDLIGSNNFASDASGNAGVATAYSAFGELVSGYSALEGRYGGYCGGWGYENGLLSLTGPNGSLAPVSLQHVGERWYQVGIGRFVQRDSIGILAGLNTYSYCHQRPTFAVDPTGAIDDPILDLLRETISGWVFTFGGSSQPPPVPHDSSQGATSAEPAESSAADLVRTVAPGLAKVAIAAAGRGLLAGIEGSDVAAGTMAAEAAAVPAEIVSTIFVWPFPGSGYYPGLYCATIGNWARDRFRHIGHECFPPGWVQQAWNW